MAKCTVSGADFIHHVFSPCVALYSTSDVNDICLRAALTFKELLLPFSQLSKDVTIRDSNNLHTVSNLKIKFLDASSLPAPTNVARSHLHEIVLACSSDYSIETITVSNDGLSVCVPDCTPWFEAWRYVFLKSLRPSVHEFVDCCLACIFTVSTTHPDPLTALDALNQQQQQQQLSIDGSYPRWFNTSVAKFYVLLHTSSQTESDHASVIFARMEKFFGAANCYLLTLFTQESPTTTAKSELSINGSIPTAVTKGGSCHFSDIHADPWLSHLLPHGYRPPVTQTSPIPCDAPRVQPSLSTDPLFVKSVENRMDAAYLGTPEFVEDKQEQHQESLIPPRLCQPHGKGLSQADLDCLRNFVYDFVVRCLLPWVEQTIRSLTEQTAHRMRLSRSLLSATKKFFGGTVSTGSSVTSSNNALNPSAQSLTTAPSTLHTFGNSLGIIGMLGSGGHIPPISSESVMARTSIASSREELRPALTPQSAPIVVYTSDASEMQMRRLADLAFLFQQYEVAHQTYNVLRRDFQNDSAPLYCAGAQEMSALSIFLQGTTSQRQYPHHYVDSAVTAYLQSCRAPELALRATLLNAEALCSRGRYAEAAMSLLRLTSVDDDLTSALLIEQTAYCVLRMRKPMLRKFAFRMALAAHRYNRARQAHLAIRSYKLAFPILSGRNWSLIEDHINYNLGKQAYLLGDLAASAASLRQSLDRPSKQPPERQYLFVREYLIVLKKYLNERTHREDGPPDVYPEFPLPKIRLTDVKSMLGKPVRPSNDLPVDARGVQFSDTSEVEQSLHWWRVDAQDLFPCWMEGTDVSDTESEEEQTETHDQSISLPWDVHPQTLDHNSPLTSDHLTDRLEWLLQRTTLEPTTTAPIHKSPDPPLPHPLRVLHTRRSVPYQKPIAPIGEPITCQFPLSNPMHIPLVLHNLHLLWSFQMDSSRTTTGLLQQQPQHLRVISNETNSVVATSRSIRQLVSTDVLSELILLPEENKTFEVGLVVRQKGELLIHGLCFDWDYQSTQFVQSATFDTNDPVEGIAVEHLVKSAFSAPETIASVQESLRLAKNGFITGKWMGSSFPNYESASAVRGKVTLLNFSLNVDAGEPKLPETLSPLAWTITNAAPLLKVAFSDLPSKILQGQVFRLELTLSNLGSEPLSRIRLASNWPGSITFGSDGFSRNPDHSVIYETRDSHTQCHSIWRSVLAVQPWIEVPYYQSHEPVPVLLPGSTVSIPMWLRAPHLSHSYRSLPKSRMARRRASTPISIYGPSSATQQRLIHLAFQYAVTKQNQDYPVLNYRFVRHHHELELRPSLRLEALAVPSHCTGVHTLLILLRIHNQTPKSTKTSFEILQVSCGSRNWAISPPPSSLPVHMVDRPRVDPGGTIVLYLQAVPSLSYPDDQDSTTSTPITRSVTRTLFTTVPYSSGELVEVTASPCIDFYQLSGVNWNHSIRKRPNKESLGITLVVLWKAHVASVDPSEGAFYGQSHVSITRLGIPAVVPFEEHHPPDQPRISPCPSEPVVTPRSSQLVRLHLRHASRLVHTFCTRPLLSNRPSASTCSPLAPNPAPCTAPLQTAMLDSIQWVTKCLAVIPVEVVLFNATCVPVELVLESSDVTSQANEQNSLASIPLNQHELLNPLVCRRLGANAVMSCVRWVGLIRQRFMLSANESRVLHLEARVPRPGMYRLDNLLLRAREKVPSGGEFVSQAIPTSWVLVDADASTAVSAQSNPMNGYASPLLHSTCTSPCVPYC